MRSSSTKRSQDDQQGAIQLDQARRLPFIFDLSQYGDHFDDPAAAASLSSLMVPLVPVEHGAGGRLYR